MSIAFGGAMKDSEDDALNEAMRGMRKTASKRKRIVTVRGIFGPHPRFYVARRKIR
jgi:hypothetical protein